jgi:hypothetical protein
MNSTTKATAEIMQIIRAEQHIAQQPVGYGRNKRGNQKVPGI